jgi:hypothetical protein
VHDGGVRGKSLPLTLNRLYYEAPEDKRRQLEELYRRDSEVDAAAIGAWRESHGIAVS